MNNIALTLAKHTQFLQIVIHSDGVPMPIKARAETLLHEMLNIGEELVNELADEGHCAVFVDCGEHNYGWNCAMKKGLPCKFHHRRVEDASDKP